MQAFVEVCVHLLGPLPWPRTKLLYTQLSRHYEEFLHHYKPTPHHSTCSIPDPEPIIFPVFFRCQLHYSVLWSLFLPYSTHTLSWWHSDAVPLCVCLQQCQQLNVLHYIYTMYYYIYLIVRVISINTGCRKDTEEMHSLTSYDREINIHTKT